MYEIKCIFIHFIFKSSHQFSDLFLSFQTTVEQLCMIIYPEKNFLDLQMAAYLALCLHPPAKN